MAELELTLILPLSENKHYKSSIFHFPYLKIKIKKVAFFNCFYLKINIPKVASGGQFIGGRNQIKPQTCQRPLTNLIT